MTSGRRWDSGRIVVLGACLVIAACGFFRVFSAQELFFYDLRFFLRGSVPVTDKIAIIQISDDTLMNLGQWPLPRDFHASLTDVLKSLGARAIVFDLLLSEPSEQDKVLAQSFHRAGSVYLPLAFYVQGGRSRGVLGGIAPSLESSLAGKGHINVAVDPDGKNRRIPLFILHEGSWVPNLALKVACDVLGRDLSRPVFRDNAVIVDRRLALPVSRGAFLVNYPGYWKNTFAHFSYYEVLRAFKMKAEGASPAIDLTIFKDKVCFVGLTATGTSDFRANPLENVYPMVGLQASVFNSIVQKDFLREAEPFENVVLALALFLVSLAVSLTVAPLFAFFLNVILAAVVFFAGQAVFSGLGVWIDFFLPALVIALTYGGSLFHRFLKEARERQLLEKELEIARAIQDNFLPRDIPSVGGVRVAALMQPAKFVAGDLYDVVALDKGRRGVLIGDVSGKGVSASLIMAQTVSFFRIFARQHATPADVLTALNKELVPLLQGRFVTAIYLVVDTQDRVFSAACAGHFPLMIYRSSDAVVTELDLDGGPPLGIVEGYVYKNTLGVAGAGDRMLLYTDGITEARKGNEEYGVERLKIFLKENAARPAEEIVRSLAAALGKFQKASLQHDDITSVVIDFQ
jgi:adenylate cyclase